MSAIPLAVRSTGLVTAVGLNAPATCAAIRAGLSNPTATPFVDTLGEHLMAQQVSLAGAPRGRAKVRLMAVIAIEEALREVVVSEWAGIPLLLCVAEKERPGRIEGLDDRLLGEIQAELGASFAPQSMVLAHGRVGVAVALARARALIQQHGFSQVLVVATDGLISWSTLTHYLRDGRLLSTGNSNGFIPGEGAGAVLVGHPSGAAELLCTGIGFGVEKADLLSLQALRADGLTLAIKDALRDGECAMNDMDYRIADLSGEHYYFKEAALALARTLRDIREEFDLWHPAECIGEAGALCGVAILALADAACRKSFGPGPGVLAHFSNDGGQRAAVVMRYAEST